MMLLTPNPKNEWRSPQGAGKLSFADEQHPDSKQENATHGQIYRTRRTRVKLHGRDDGPERPASTLPGRRDQCRALIQVLRSIPRDHHLCLATLTSGLCGVRSAHRVVVGHFEAWFST